jgi:hypothetical protein
MRVSLQIIMGAVLGPMKPFQDTWSFIDSFQSVNCNRGDTSALCVVDKNSTLVTKETFPAGGRFSIQLKVLGVNPQHPMGFGIVPIALDLDAIGKHFVGEREIQGSVGLVCVRRSSRLLRADVSLGQESPDVPDGATVEVIVEAGRLRVTVNGTQFGPTVEGLTGRLRFAVSLCGSGQRVAIEGGAGDVRDAEYGNILLGRLVAMKDRETLARLPFPVPDQFKARSGCLGEIMKFDPSDGTYEVRFGCTGFWCFPECFDVLNNVPTSSPTSRRVAVVPPDRGRSHHALSSCGVRAMGARPSGARGTRTLQRWLSTQPTLRGSAAP